jgi:hypothetical protein
MTTASVFGAAAISLAIWAYRLPPGSDPITAELGRPMNLRTTLAWAFIASVGMLGIFAILRAKLPLFSFFSAAVLAWALWFSWDHWVNLSHHWTQRDLFRRYYDYRKPGEPIAAYQMDWKGETFYSRNTVKQIKADSKLIDYIRLPGRKWVLVEQGLRSRSVQQTAAGHPVEFYDPEINAKLLLLSID